MSQREGIGKLQNQYQQLMAKAQQQQNFRNAKEVTVDGKAIEKVMDCSSYIYQNKLAEKQGMEIGRHAATF